MKAKKRLFEFKNNEGDVVALRECAQCKNKVPSSFFNKDSTRCDGLMRVCRSCMARYKEQSILNQKIKRIEKRKIKRDDYISKCRINRANNYRPQCYIRRINDDQYLFEWKDEHYNVTRSLFKTHRESVKYCNSKKIEFNPLNI